MILRRALALLVATVGPALAQGPPAATSAPTVLDCTDAFARNADEAALVRRFGRANVVAADIDGAFGRANVVAADIDGAEGSTERGTIVYPKDPARRLEILWFDAERRRRPATILVRGRSGWAVRAPGAGGTIALGTPLAEVEAANGRPFALSGFGWDMGGYATGWKGRALGTIAGGCSLSVRFNPEPKAADAALTRVSGDKPFASSDPRVRAVKPLVTQLSLDWPE